MSALLAASLATVTAARGEAARPITLSEALAAAFDQNPNVDAAEHRIAAARAAIVQARSAFFPTVSVGQSYAASNSPIQAFMMTLSQRAFDIAGADFNHPGTVDNFGTRLVGRWQIYDGGRDTAGVAATQLAAAAAEDRLEAARNSLVFEVTRAYYETVKARHFVTAAEAAIADRETSRALAENLRAAGAALETDVLDAEVALAAGRADLVSARSALAVAEAVLSSVVGSSSRERLTAAEPDGGLDQVPAAPQTEEPGYLERPELAAARKLVEQAEKQVRAARAAWLPHISAFGRYDLDSGDFQDFADSWAAGVSVELDLFDGLRTQGAIADAEARRSTAIAELRRTELALELEWRRARFGVDESAARLATTAAATQQAARSLAITRERYREGLELFSRVLSAEAALAEARQRRVAALSDHRIAIAALERATGQGWEKQFADSEPPTADVEGEP